MAYGEGLAQRVRQEIGDRQGYEEKRVFGGIGFMMDGNMACGVISEELIVRMGSDQLSLFVTDAHYFHEPSGPALVTAPFASGCGLIAAAFEALDQPRAIVGATDIAMRKYLPPDILAFTVTRPMFEEFCALDEDSFLGKPFWQQVKEKRGRFNE